MLKYHDIDEDGKMTPCNETPAVGLSTAERVVMPRSDLIALETARYELWQILEQCNITAMQLAMIQDKTSTMWRIANTNWPKAL